MKNEILLEDNSNTLPLQIINEIAAHNGWQVKNCNEEEISIDINTCFGDIGMFFSWSSDLQLLQISSILDIHIDTDVYPEVYELLSLINEKLLLGHFSMISGTCFPLYRNSIMVSDRKLFAKRQINELINIAFEESHRYFTAFAQLKNGSDAKSAIIMAMPDHMGHA